MASALHAAMRGPSAAALELTALAASGAWLILAAQAAMYAFGRLAFLLGVRPAVVAESGRGNGRAQLRALKREHLGACSVRRSWYRSLGSFGRLRKAPESCCILEKSRKQLVNI